MLTFTEVATLVPSLCGMPSDPLWAIIPDIFQITLGASICLLVCIWFVRESLQMHNATKVFQLSRYMLLLVGEEMIYFLWYVHLSSILPFDPPFH